MSSLPLQEVHSPRLLSASVINTGDFSQNSLEVAEGELQGLSAFEYSS